MKTGRDQMLDKITELHEQISNLTLNYWAVYSNINTWQFWVLVSFIVLPLAALYFLIDRRKIFLIGFFGFNIHAWFHYCDLFFVERGLIAYLSRRSPSYRPACL